MKKAVKKKAKKKIRVWVTKDYLSLDSPRLHFSKPEPTVGEEGFPEEVYWRSTSKSFWLYHLKSLFPEVKRLKGGPKAIREYEITVELVKEGA